VSVSFVIPAKAGIASWRGAVSELGDASLRWPDARG
jgi:hypothetical protein